MYTNTVNVAGENTFPAVLVGSMGPNYGCVEHFVLMLVALCFIKLHIFLNTIPEGNLLRSVRFYLNMNLQCGL